MKFEKFAIWGSSNLQVISNMETASQNDGIIWNDLAPVVFMYAKGNFNLEATPLI